MEGKGQPNQGTGPSTERLNQQNPGNMPENMQEGGQAGYSSDGEQQEVNRENDDMHNERDEDGLDTSEGQKITTKEGGGTTPNEHSDKSEGMPR